MPARDTDPLTVLFGVADASVEALKDLKTSVRPDTLRVAARMIGSAESVTVVATEQASPVAALLAEGLKRRAYRCSLIQTLCDREIGHVSTLRVDDVLIAICLCRQACAVARALPTARARRVRVLGIADRIGSPVAPHADVSFVMRDGEPDEVQPLAPYIVLVQSLLMALDEERRRETGRSR